MTLQLVCFHSAGSDGSMFTAKCINRQNVGNALVEYCDSNNYQLFCPNLSGRCGIPGSGKLDIAGEAARIYKEHSNVFQNGNFVLVGHSLGSMVVHELIRLLNKHNNPSPLGVVISGSVSPLLPASERPWVPITEQTTDSELKTQLTAWGVSKIALDPPFWDVFGPRTARDMIGVSSYESSGAVSAFCSEIIGICTTDDPFVRKTHLADQQFAYINYKSFKTYELPGSHNVLQEVENRKTWFETVVNFISQLKQPQLDDEPMCF